MLVAKDMYFYLLMNEDFLLLLVSNQFLPPVKAEVWKCFKFVVELKRTIVTITFNLLLAFSQF